VLLRVFVAATMLTFGAAAHAEAAAPSATTIDPVAATVPDSTLNDFLPEERAISDCVSAVPKPGCGSKARGGWHQDLVAVLLVGGLAIVGWRIVAGVRRTPARH
jgi:hypothetical protein